MSHFLPSVQGRDEATGCLFSVAVAPADTPDEGHELDVAVKCIFSWPSNEGPIPPPTDDMSWWKLDDPERRFTLRENLIQWLKNSDVPLTSRNETIRLIFDYMYSSRDVVVDSVLVRIDMGYVPDHDLEGDVEEEWDRVPMIEDLPMQEDSTRRAAASQEAVEALEKVSFRGVERDTGCAVCLEEFSVGLEVPKMPCSHVFHGDYILRWLDHQRFCPLCRFELPPAQEYSEFEDMEWPDMILPSEAESIMEVITYYD